MLYLIVIAGLLITLVAMAFEIRELRWQNRQMANALNLAHLKAADAREAARIAGSALVAEEEYAEDHRMLIAQAREVIEGEGGRPARVWVGDEFVEVEAGEEGDVEVGQQVAAHDYSWHEDPYANPRDVVTMERWMGRGWFPIRRMWSK